MIGKVKLLNRVHFELMPLGKEDSSHLPPTNNFQTYLFDGYMFQIWGNDLWYTGWKYYLRHI